MADSAETVKKTVEQTASTAKVQADQVQAAQAQAGAQAGAQAEQVQAAGAKAFRDGIEKTTATFGELNAQGKQNLDAIVASATAAQKGAEALSAQALSYGKTSWETGVEAAKTMSQARSIQELIELQTSFTKSAMEVYLSNVTRMTETLTASVKDSFQPINERVTASVEKFQAAR